MYGLDISFSILSLFMAKYIYFLCFCLFTSLLIMLDKKICKEFLLIASLDEPFSFLFFFFSYWLIKRKCGIWHDLLVLRLLISNTAQGYTWPIIRWKLIENIMYPLNLFRFYSFVFSYQFVYVEKMTITNDFRAK